MREACKFKVRIHNGNILISSVTKDPGVSSILLFSGSGINFPRPLYIIVHKDCSCKIFVLLLLESFQLTKVVLLKGFLVETVKQMKICRMRPGWVCLSLCLSPSIKSSINDMLHVPMKGGFKLLVKSWTQKECLLIGTGIHINMQIMVYITLIQDGYYSIADPDQVMCEELFSRECWIIQILLCLWNNRTLKLKISYSEHKLETKTKKRTSKLAVLPEVGQKTGWWL